MSLLSLERVTMRFNGVTAVEDMSFTVAREANIDFVARLREDDLFRQVTAAENAEVI